MMIRGDGISAEANMRLVHVKAAVAAGRSQNRIREATGVAALVAPKAA